MQSQQIPADKAQPASVPPVTYRDLALIHDRLEKGDQRMGRIEQSQALAKQAIDDNTEITSEIRDLITSVKTGFKVLGGLGIAAKWVAAIAGAASAVWALIYAATHGGQLPK
jgi:hypothetical protein